MRSDAPSESSVRAGHLIRSLAAGLLAAALALPLAGGSVAPAVASSAAEAVAGDAAASPESASGAGTSPEAGDQGEPASAASPEAEGTAPRYEETGLGEGDAPASARDWTSEQIEEMRAGFAQTFDAHIRSAWDAGETAILPGTSHLWDSRQQRILDERIADAEAAGWTVYAAVAEKPEALGFYDDVHYTAGWQRALDAYFADSTENVLVVIPDGLNTLGARLAAYESGSRIRELAGIRPEPDYAGPEINRERAGAAAAAALGVFLDGGDFEARPDEAIGHHWNGEEVDTRDWEITAPRIAFAVIWPALLIGGVLIAVLVIGFRVQRSGWIGRRLNQRIGRDDEAARLVALRSAAVDARARLVAADSLSGSLETAIGRLPDPEETTSPLVWAGWTAVDAEHRGKRPRCFFRPDREATTTANISVFGADVTVRVSPEAAEQIEKSREPDFISLAGIDRGRPYWRDPESPFSASGFGSFGPLSEAIARMPAGWQPKPGAARVERVLRRSETASAKPGSGRRRPNSAVAVPLLALIAVLGLTAGGFAGSIDSEARKTMAIDPDITDSVEARLAAMEAGLDADGVYIDYSMTGGLLRSELDALSDDIDVLAEEIGRPVEVLAVDEGRSDLRRAGFGSRSDIADYLIGSRPEGTLLFTVDMHRASAVSAAVGYDTDYDIGSDFDAGPVANLSALMRAIPRADEYPVTNPPEGTMPEVEGADESPIMPETAAWGQATTKGLTIGLIVSALGMALFMWIGYRLAREPGPRRSRAPGRGDDRSGPERHRMDLESRKERAYERSRREKRKASEKRRRQEATILFTREKTTDDETTEDR